uniref:Uncharacterized protein n=1 Tax=Arundo donax TaxID=35708 RepID=A0A0A9D4T2_ARUDO
MFFMYSFCAMFFYPYDVCIVSAFSLILDKSCICKRKRHNFFLPELTHSILTINICTSTSDIFVSCNTCSNGAGVRGS